MRHICLLLLLTASLRLHADSVVINDVTTQYGIGIQNGSAPCMGSCDLSPSYNHYAAPFSFKISKITFNWATFGGNNCDGIGNYGAIISSTNDATGVLATSINTVYLGCAGFNGGTSGTGELDFAGQTVPSSFYLDFASFDGGLQGGAGTSVFNIEIWQTGTPTPIQVLIVPGILGTKLSASSNVPWLTNSQLTSAFADDVTGNTPGIIQVFSQLEYDDDGTPTTNLQTADLFNYVESPLPANELNCQSLPQSLLSDCGADLNTYNNLRDYLRANGFVPQSFAYDWRMDLTALSTQLYNTVSQIMEQNPGGQVSLISHSMGGLIVGKMLTRIATGELAPLQAQLGPVITLGTPFGGAVDAYLKLRGWQGLLPWIINGPASIAIGKNWSSAYELLPRSDFVSVDLLGLPFASVYNGTSFASDLFPPLPRQNALPIADSFWNTNSVGQPSVFRIIGTGQHTAQAVVGYENTIINSGSTPALCKLQVVRGDGDNTVPVASATNQRFLPTTNIFYVQDTHIHLPSNTSVLAAIGNILSAQAVTLPTTSAGIQPEWDVLTCSPVSLQITDAAANVTNLHLQQIPDSAAFSLGEATQVSVPGTGQFAVELTGTAVGSFDLIFNKTDSNGQILQQATFLIVPVLNGSKAHVALDESGPGSLTLDLQGNGAIEFSISPSTQPNTVTSLQVLIAVIQALGLPQGIEVSLTSKLRNATADLGRGQNQSTLGILNAFTNEVSAQSGKALSPGDAASLVTIVNRLMTSIANQLP